MAAVLAKDAFVEGAIGGQRLPRSPVSLPNRERLANVDFSPSAARLSAGTCTISRQIGQRPARPAILSAIFSKWPDGQVTAIDIQQAATNGANQPSWKRRIQFGPEQPLCKAFGPGDTLREKVHREGARTRKKITRQKLRTVRRHVHRFTRLPASRTSRLRGESPDEVHRIVRAYGQPACAPSKHDPRPDADRQEQERRWLGDRTNGGRRNRVRSRRKSRCLDLCDHCGRIVGREAIELGGLSR